MLDNKLGVIILAAGKGKRLNCSEKPKAMCEIGGRPILSYVLNEFKNWGIKEKQICLVVGYKKEKVREFFRGDYIYAEQKTLLGTAHAAHTGEKKLPQGIEMMLVINGDDSAFYKDATLRNLIATHVQNNNDITLLASEQDVPAGLGRIIRDNEGGIVAIKEKENLKSSEENIKEINTGTYCFKRDWFNRNYFLLKPLSGLGELGLTSFVEMAVEDGSKLGSKTLMKNNEWFGINTPEQLAEADKRKRLCNS